MARIITKSGKVLDMTLNQANWYLINNSIENFYCEKANGITYFFIK